MGVYLKVRFRYRSPTSLGPGRSSKTRQRTTRWPNPSNCTPPSSTTWTRTMGPENRYAISALQRLSQTEMVGAGLSSFSYRDPLIDFFKKVYPEKCGYVGELSLRRLVQEGDDLRPGQWNPIRGRHGRYYGAHVHLRPRRGK